MHLLTRMTTGTRFFYQHPLRVVNSSNRFSATLLNDPTLTQA
jgi:hypothetical protein